MATAALHESTWIGAWPSICGLVLAGDERGGRSVRLAEPAPCRRAPRSLAPHRGRSSAMAKAAISLLGPSGRRADPGATARQDVRGGHQGLARRRAGRRRRSSLASTHIAVGISAAPPRGPCPKTI